MRQGIWNRRMKKLQSNALADRPNSADRAADLPRRKLGLLIVDEDALMRVMLKLEFERRGLEVWHAASWRQAEQVLRDHRKSIAVMLMDAGLAAIYGPRLSNGFPEIERLPICFLADKPSDYRRDDSRREGPRHVLCKPYQIEEIVQIVQCLAENSNGQAQDD